MLTSGLRQNADYVPYENGEEVFKGRKSDVSEGHWSAHAIKKLVTFEGDVSTSLVVFIRVATGDAQEYKVTYPLEEPRTPLENFIKK